MAKRGKLPTCSRCGCTDAKGCERIARAFLGRGTQSFACWWVRLGDAPLCSACASPAERVEKIRELAVDVPRLDIVPLSRIVTTTLRGNGFDAAGRWRR